MWSALVLALVPVAAHPPTDLPAAARASNRPAECLATDAGARNAVWTRARTPRLDRYCQLLSRAQARLATNPAGSEEAANAADEALPGRASPKIVLARLALAKNDPEAALALFEAALRLDPRSVEQPAAMHDMARAQRRSGKLEAALATYRVVVPRAALLPDRARRASVLLEAAHAALAAGKDDARAVDEALAYLREAARDPHHPMRRDVTLSLVLALHRAGHRGQADAVLAEVRGLSDWADEARGEYLARAGDLVLLRAIALESERPEQAAALYREAIAGGAGPNEALARERMAALEPAPRRRR